MIKFNFETLIAVDIDYTLVYPCEENGVTEVKPDLILQDPYNVLGKQKLMINFPNVNVVKRGYNRGYRYFAWSVSGVQWTEAVIKALNMEKYIEFVITKPTRYIDDKPVQEWMTDRTWLEPYFAGWTKNTLSSGEDRQEEEFDKIFQKANSIYRNNVHELQKDHEKEAFKLSNENSIKLTNDYLLHEHSFYSKFLNQ